MKILKYYLYSGFILLLLTDPAFAHVKWFVEFDVSEPPLQLTEVFNITFWILLAMASIALYFTFVVDMAWSKKEQFDMLKGKFDSSYESITTMVRTGTGVFFIAIWLIGDIILTPELQSQSAIVPYLHILIAISVLFRSTLILAAEAIVALYIFGVVEYGFYHMIDYVVFLGLAAYLALTTINKPQWLHHRLPILVVCMLFSFLWSAIEKFAYPNWFDPFLDQYEFLTMGIDRDIFLMCAAFVEFTLVYVLLVARNVVAPFALALNVLIIAGAVYFGKIDAIGHFIVMVILVIMMLRGQSTYQIIAYEKNRNTLFEAGKAVGIYWSFLAMFFSLYYGAHRLAYGL